MNTLQTIFLGSLGIGILFWTDFSEGNTKVRVRPRRYLSFGNISHFFGNVIEITVPHNKPLLTKIASRSVQDGEGAQLVSVGLRVFIVGVNLHEKALQLAWLRLNFKANMVPWTQIFAQAMGFRVNWDDPPDSFHPYHHIHRRALYNYLQILLDKNGLDGFNCIRRAICETEAIQEPNGLYHRVLKIIFREGLTGHWRGTTTTECQLSAASCPFSFLDVSLYTDQ